MLYIRLNASEEAVRQNIPRLPEDVSTSVSH